MIVGEVAPTHEIVVALDVHDAGGVPRPVRAAADTGFSSYPTSPPAMIASFGLSKSGDVTVILGDGSEAFLPKYDATIVWDGQDRTVSVYAADGDPLIGMTLLYGFDFHVHVVDGGMVALNRLT